MKIQHRQLKNDRSRSSGGVRSSRWTFWKALCLYFRLRNFFIADGSNTRRLETFLLTIPPLRYGTGKTVFIYDDDVSVTRTHFPGACLSENRLKPGQCHNYTTIALGRKGLLRWDARAIALGRKGLSLHQKDTIDVVSKTM